MVHMGDEILSYFIGKTESQSFGLKPSLKMEKMRGSARKKLYTSMLKIIDKVMENQEKKQHINRNKYERINKRNINYMVMTERKTQREGQIES